MRRRAAEAILEVGPSAVAGIGVTALLVDQASFPGGTVADELGLPFATVCNALLLHPDPAVPPYFTSWRPRDASWARLRNRIAWAGLSRLYAPILGPIQQRRRRLCLSVPARIVDTWSSRLQISQQPKTFEFPLSNPPEAGPVRRPAPAPRGLPAGTVPLGPARRSAAHLRVARHPPEPRLGDIPDDCEGVRRSRCPIGHLHRPRDRPGRTGRPAGPAGGCALRARAGTSTEGRSRGYPRRPEHCPRRAEHGTPLGCHAPDQRTARNCCPDGLDWSRGGDSLRQATIQRLRNLVVRVLSDPSYRQAAERVRDSMQAGGGAHAPPRSSSRT